MKGITESQKAMLMAFAPLIAVVLLFYFVGSFGFSKISEVRVQLAGESKNQATLTQKLAILRTVSDTLATGASFAATALPDSNPSLLLSSQLKNLSSQNQVNLSGLKGGPEVTDSTGLSRVDLTLDVTGTRESVLDFAKAIEGMAPITHIDKIKITEGNNQVRASLSLRSFWSPLPTKLPSLTEQITDLTADERALLSDLSGLTQPTISTAPVPASSGKTDPFTQ